MNVKCNNIISCNYGKCNHYRKCNVCAKVFMESVIMATANHYGNCNHYGTTYGKFYLWKM